MKSAVYINLRNRRINKFKEFVKPLEETNQAPALFHKAISKKASNPASSPSKSHHVASPTKLQNGGSPNNKAFGRKVAEALLRT